jgi:putative tryptophan/tyrosine transport system substrate-binding protein
MNDPQPEGHMASCIGRRKFLATLLGGAAAWPLAARAQSPEQMRRIGLIAGSEESDLRARSHIAGFQQALQALGWTPDHNIRIEHRWTSDPNIMPAHAADL